METTFLLKKKKKNWKVFFYFHAIRFSMTLKQQTLLQYFSARRPSRAWNMTRRMHGSHTHLNQRRRRKNDLRFISKFLSISSSSFFMISFLMRKYVKYSGNLALDIWTPSSMTSIRIYRRRQRLAVRGDEKHFYFNLLSFSVVMAFVSNNYKWNGGGGG